MLSVQKVAEISRSWRPGRIVTGVINSSSQSGSAGSSKITGQKDVEVVSIKASGNTGGDVAIEAGGTFRAAGTGTSADRASSVSISTDGQVRSGSLTLLQSTCPFGKLHNCDCWDRKLEVEPCHPNYYRAPAQPPESCTNYHRGTKNYRQFSTNCHSDPRSVCAQERYCKCILRGNCCAC